MPIKQSINRSIDQNKPRNKQTDIVTYNHRMKEQHNFLTQESSEMYGFKIGIFFYDWNKLVWPSSLLFKTSAVRWKQWKSQLQEWEKIRHTSCVCVCFFLLTGGPRESSWSWHQHWEFHVLWQHSYFKTTEHGRTPNHPRGFTGHREEVTDS